MITVLTDDTIRLLQWQNITAPLKVIPKILKNLYHIVIYLFPIISVESAYKLILNTRMDELCKKAPYAPGGPGGPLIVTRDSWIEKEVLAKLLKG